MKLKLKTYCIVSTIMTLCLITFSVFSHETLYESLSEMAQSEAAALVFANFSFMVILLFGIFIKNAFFGALSNEEIDTVVENSKWSLLNLFMVITMFTDDLNAEVLTFIVLYIFFKIFHWIVGNRVDAIHQMRIQNLFDRSKLAFFISSLLVADTFCVLHFTAFLQSRVYDSGIGSVAIFEFANMALSALYFGSKYSLNIFDIKHNGRWNKKPFLTFLLKMTFLLLSASIYIFFVYYITWNYGLPIYLFRDIYTIFFKLKSTYQKYKTYNILVNALHANFPDIKGAGFENLDRVCIICREDMLVGKKLPCRHIFHLECLRSWFERQNTCPTCRSSIPIYSRSAATNPVGRHRFSNNITDDGFDNSDGDGDNNIDNNDIDNTDNNDIDNTDNNDINNNRSPERDDNYQMTDSDSTANLKNENSTLPTKNIERLNRQNILRTEEDREEKEMIEHCERQMVQIKGNLVVLRRKMEEKIRLRRLMNENHATLQLLIKYQKELNEPLGKNIRSRVEDGGLKFSGGVVVPVPVHFIEAQTLLLQEQVAVQSANLSKSQRILRNQMELFRQFQLLQQQKL